MLPFTQILLVQNDQTLQSSRVLFLLTTPQNKFLQRDPIYLKNNKNQARKMAKQVKMLAVKPDGWSEVSSWDCILIQAGCPLTSTHNTL